MIRLQKKTMDLYQNSVKYTINLIEYKLMILYRVVCHLSLRYSNKIFIMKRIIKILVLSLVVCSCNNNTTDNKDKKPSSDIETTTVVTPKDDIDKVVEQTNLKKAEKRTEIHITEQQWSSTVLDFQNCKAVSEKRSDCRNKITAFISKVYKLNEFRDAKNEYVIYDSIRPIISKSQKWKNLGLATHQQNIDAVLKHVNDGGLAIVIDTSNTYGHVVVIQPGETKKSGSWGMKLPNVLSLANHKPSKSFCNKSLAYAFSKSDDLQVYVRE